MYHSGYETGDNLAQELQKRLTENFYPITSLNNIKPKAGDVLIRWGTTRKDEKDDQFIRAGGKVLNSANSIFRNTNKLKSIDIFKRAGLNTARVYTNKRDIQQFPVLGRDRNHHGGLDIVVINGNNNLRQNDFNKIPNKDYYIEYIPSKVEYRVHVFQGEIIRVTKKVFKGHDRDGNPVHDKGTIKNDTYGWGHSNINIEEFPREYKAPAIAAVEAIGLDFGAVDMLIGANDRKPYILEVNSACRLNTIGLDIYSRKISSIFQEKKRPIRNIVARAAKRIKGGSYLWG